MPLRAVIVDDEPLARKGMEEDLRGIDCVEVIGLAGSSVDAIGLIASHQPDLLFLDINLPRLNGLDLIRSLREPPMVIVVTAYPEYALRGYELDVIDYLIKPVDPARLLKACQRAHEYFSLRQQAAQGPGKASPYLFVKCNGKFEKVAFRDLLFIEAADNYIFLHCANRKLMIHESMRHIETLLPAEGFMKIHKSFIVGLDHIHKIDRKCLLLGSHRLPVSRNFRKALLSRLAR